MRLLSSGGWLGERGQRIMRTKDERLADDARRGRTARRSRKENSYLCCSTVFTVIIAPRNKDNNSQSLALSSISRQPSRHHWLVASRGRKGYKHPHSLSFSSPLSYYWPAALAQLPGVQAVYVPHMYDNEVAYGYMLACALHGETMTAFQYDAGGSFPCCRFPPPPPPPPPPLPFFGPSPPTHSGHTSLSFGGGGLARSQSLHSSTCGHHDAQRRRG